MMRRGVVIGIIVFFMTSLSFGRSVCREENGEMTVEVHFQSPEVSNSMLRASDGDVSFQRVMLENARNIAHPGEPNLPLTTVTVLIPQGCEVTGVSVLHARTETLAGKHFVEPAQMEVPLSLTGPVAVVRPKAEVYGATTVYPENIVESYTMQYCRGYRLVVISLRPVRYFPAEEKLIVHRDIALKISTRPVPGRNPEIVRCRGIEADRKWVARKVLNPEDIATYRVEPAPEDSPLAGRRENYPYVIVTDAALEDSFTPLITHKQSVGFPGAIVTMDWVQANYTGVDWAEQLRNFIIDAYNNWNLQYVLLGGDDDRSDAGGESGDHIVPRRDFYADTDYGTSDDAIPCDMYYACLDGSFNDNGNSLWGEPDDGVGGGEVDWFGEVHVGRACVDSPAEAEGFVNAIIAYETTSPDASHMKKAWMVGELLWDDPTYGGDYKDEIKNGASTNGYTTVGFPGDWTVNTLYDRDLSSDWTATDILDIMNSNDVHVINHLGHSNVNYCMRLYNSDVDGLTNTNGFFAYSQGCYDGSFDDRNDSGGTESYDCILEHHTVQAHGAFAFIGNSRYGWGEHSSTNGSSQYFDRQFFDAVFGEGIKNLGAANQDSKEDNVGYLSYGANRWVGYELTLFGDPQTSLGNEISGDGRIEMDAAYYGNNGAMTITVRDDDLNGDSGAAETVSVTVESDAGDHETVTLTETGVDTAIFTGQLQVENDTVNPENGALEASHGDTLTATYIDADDGHGGVNVPKTAVAHADFVSPAISGVTVNSITDTSAVIEFSTDENSAGAVYYGETAPPGTDVPEGGSGTSHSVTLTGLTPCTTYIFYVTAEDGAGNISRDDNGGMYYTFTTWMRQTMFGESMDADPGWTADPLWAFGVPSGGGGEYGNPDPSSGYTGSNVYGYNLSGDYENGLDEKYLTSPVFDCSGASSITLTFYRWLNVEQPLYDHARVQVRHDGGTWVTIWENQQQITDNAWVYCSYDVSDELGGFSDCQIRWVMGTTDSSWQFSGWNIDDVAVLGSVPCGTPTPAGTPTPVPTDTPVPSPTPSFTPTGTPSPTATPPCIHHGDVNFSGRVTAGDALLTFRIALEEYDPSFDEECAADCDGSGRVTAGDAQGVFYTALGMQSCADPLEKGGLLPVPEFRADAFLPESVWLESRWKGDTCIVRIMTSLKSGIQAFTVVLAFDEHLVFKTCRPGSSDQGWTLFDGNAGTDIAVIAGVSAGKAIAPGPDGCIGQVYFLCDRRDMLGEAPVRLLHVDDDLLDR